MDDEIALWGLKHIYASLGSAIQQNSGLSSKVYNTTSYFGSQTSDKELQY